MLQAAWLAGWSPLEIDRPFVDFAGYDLVVTCGPVTRHVQLKATAGQITVHRALATKPSGCVVNLRPLVAGDPARIGFRYDLYADKPGTPLDLEGLRAARKAHNTRQPDGGFGKAERLQHVVVPVSRFTRNLVSSWAGCSARRRWLDEGPSGSIFGETNGAIHGRGLSPTVVGMHRSPPAWPGSAITRSGRDVMAL